MAELKWTCGVTTVPERRHDLLPRTLLSLKGGGFPPPRLFVDGDERPEDWHKLDCCIGVTCRFPRIRAYGNWLLGLAELFVREPMADRWAMFQDDMVCSRNLRQYIDRCHPEPQGFVGGKRYLNLYTWPENLRECPANLDQQPLWHGWFKSNQRGRGAVALVFDRQGVLNLLTSNGLRGRAGVQHMVNRPLNAHRGWRSIDGGVVSAMAASETLEWVHHPTLVQHTSSQSSMGNHPHPQAVGFPGEEFDALSLFPPNPPLVVGNPPDVVR